MISLRKQIEDSENSEARGRALAKALVGLISAVPKAALPANAGLAAQCRENLEKAADPLKGEPRVPEIENAGTSSRWTKSADRTNWRLRIATRR
jgi:hypothetical protein